MKYVLLGIVQLYWLLIPQSNRRKCIFQKSCSKYVYEETQKNGLIKGLMALQYRFQNCRGGYRTFRNPINGKIEILLPNGEIIKEKDFRAGPKKCKT